MSNGLEEPGWDHMLGDITGSRDFSGKYFGNSRKRFSHSDNII